MSILAMVGIYLAGSLFWSWVLFLGGADWLEGSFLVGLLVHRLASRWDARGIKVFAAFTWLIQSVWFVVGLFVPGARLLGLS